MSSRGRRPLAQDELEGQRRPPQPRAAASSWAQATLTQHLLEEQRMRKEQAAQACYVLELEGVKAIAANEADSARRSLAADAAGGERAASSGRQTGLKPTPKYRPGTSAATTACSAAATSESDQELSPRPAADTPTTTSPWRFLAPRSPEESDQPPSSSAASAASAAERVSEPSEQPEQKKARKKRHRGGKKEAKRRLRKATGSRAQRSEDEEPAIGGRQQGQVAPSEIRARIAQRRHQRDQRGESAAAPPRAEQETRSQTEGAPRHRSPIRPLRRKRSSSIARP